MKVNLHMDFLMERAFLNTKMVRHLKGSLEIKFLSPVPSPTWMEINILVNIKLVCFMEKAVTSTQTGVAMLVNGKKDTRMERERKY